MMPADETPSASGVLRGRLLLFWANKEIDDTKDHQYHQDGCPLSK